MEEVVLTSYARTPIGKLGGGLSGLSAVDLGATAIREALNRSGIAPEQVDHVIMGTVVAAGMGQVPARQAALKAGIPVEVSALTVNKVCASGLKAVNLAAQAIRAGDADIVVAGGMESMSNAPYLLDKARFGYRMGDGAVIDSMMRDGLTCPVGMVPMHAYGSDVAAEFGITREQQDEWSLASQQRYQQALEAGKYADELVGVEVAGKRGEVTVIQQDEQPRLNSTLEALQKLKPLSPGGSITAGNAPGVNDAAAAIVVMSERKARELGVRPLVFHLGQGESNADARYLHTIPAHAICRALEKTGLRISDIGLFEINEAFAAVTLTSMGILGVGGHIVNVNGGAVALGHPIGASGARILGALMLEMRRRRTTYGAAGICSGLAQGEATIVRLAA